MSRVAEEFGCVPSVAKQELDRDADLVFEILRLRNYARAKRAYDGADAKALQTLLDDKTVQLVMETDFALAEEALKDQPAHE